MQIIKELARNIKHIDGICLIDIMRYGIYMKPTMYVSVNIGTQVRVISNIDQLYPNIFYLYDPTDKFSSLSYKLNGKYVLKITEIK